MDRREVGLAGIDPERVRHTPPMPMPMESNFLVPNATFVVVLVAIFLLLIVGGLLLGGLVWLLSRRRTTASR
jgi:hypothetical protein